MTNDSSIDVPPKKKPSIMRWIGGALLLLFVLFLWQLFGPDPAIVVSRETTYITAPLTADGLPDYGQYLLDKSREGVTPENNAAVLLWQALWPGDLEPEHYALMADELGLDEIPSGDESLQSDDSQQNQDRILAWLGPAEVKVNEDDYYTTGIPKSSDLDWQRTTTVIDHARSRPWTGDEIPPLAEWVAENKAPLDLIVEASTRSRYYSPSPTLLDQSDSSLIGMLSPNLEGLRDAARALAARAMWNLGEGRPMDAWRDLLALHRLARLLCRDGATLVDQLVAIAFDGIAADATFTLLDGADLTPDQARQIQHDLAALPDLTSMAQSIDQAERLMVLDMLCTASRDGLRELYESLMWFGDDDADAWVVQPLSMTSVDWNVVLREGNRWHDRLAAAARLPNRADRNAALGQVADDLHQSCTQASEPSQWLGALFSRQQRGQMAGVVMLKLFLPATRASFEAQDRANTTLALERLAAALAVYRAEHGTYPEKLEDLVPDVLPTLPVDLHHAKPFIYQRDGDGYLLYSAGPNGTDDGGSSDWGVAAGRKLRDLPDDEAEKFRDQIPAGADDLSIRVPRPPLALPTQQPATE